MLIETPQKFTVGTSGNFVINPDRVKTDYSYEYTIMLNNLSSAIEIGFEKVTSPQETFLLHGVSESPLTITMQYKRDRDGYTYTDTVDIRTPIQGGGYSGLFVTILSSSEPTPPSVFYTVQQLYVLLNTPDTPTFDLSVYSQGNFNALYTFIWNNLQNAVEGVSYFIEGRCGNIPTFSKIFIDGNTYESESVTISFEDLIDIWGVTEDELLCIFKLYHYDDRGLRIYDYENSVKINSVGDIITWDETTTTHPHTSPTEDDDYNPETDTLITPTYGGGDSLDNTVTSSYVLSSSALLQLRNFMWSADFHDNYLLINNNPIENIISLKTLPFSVGGGASASIKIGNVNTGISANKTSTNHTFSGLSVDIPRKYNNFLDFEPFTSLSLYLPFHGVIDLPTNLLIGKTLNVVYKFDILTGAFCAILKANETPFDFVMGNCGIDMPISAQNRTQVELQQEKARISGTANVINGTLGTIGNALQGDIIGTITSAVSTGASAYNSYLDYASATYHTMTKGAIGSQLANYVPNECYLIVDRPVYTKPSTYAHDYGYPCELSLTLGNLEGFTQCSHSLELANLPCPVDELNELRNLLTSGVYITNENIDKYANDLSNNKEIMFYKNSSDMLDTNKKLTPLFKLENVVWKEDTNALSPVFIIKPSQAWKQTNYCAVQILGRTKYFYIKNTIMRKGGIIELECHTDVLMTYNTYIRGLRTIVSRQEFKNNKDLIDKNVAVPNNREIYTKSLGTVGNPNASIVLTVSN